ncbi:phenolic acid decarboxylase [Arsenophonus nasoniae]|uniref:Phenolic acid decarboxylase n=1 Tax=Arsenophonus nasoniae TaxID=638 RepID=A0AA95GGD9_9GAMM|nr:phenolic acid decarboxylase [Arsenophonus nasoniae]WGL95890.1 phenolic acid decarboxylase [Arsenophonus nasoniae]
MSNFEKHDLTNLVGKHLVYTYENGWQHEIYIKNDNTVDYRVCSGSASNRCVKDQSAYIVQIGLNIYKASWTEPTGTSISVVLNLRIQLLHCTAFFPRWVIDEPEKTACCQNDYLNEMEAYRKAGPTYPIEIMDEFATITAVHSCELNDDSVISCATSKHTK